MSDSTSPSSNIKYVDVIKASITYESKRMKWASGPTSHFDLLVIGALMNSSAVIRENSVVTPFTKEGLSHNKYNLVNGDLRNTLVDWATREGFVLTTTSIVTSFCPNQGPLSVPALQFSFSS